jgi:two-component system sensor histidine kinase QseC
MWLRDWARRSLASRITLYVTLAFALTLCLSVAGLHVVLTHALYSRVDADLQLRLESLGRLRAARPGLESSAGLLAEYSYDAHQDFYQAWDGAGRTVARSDSSVGRDLPLPPAKTVGTGVAYELVLPDGHRGRAMAIQLALLAGDPRSDLTVLVAKETESFEALRRNLLGVMALAAAATLLVALLAARFAIDRSIAPIHTLAGQIAGIDPRSPERPAIDIGTLPAELEPFAARTLLMLDSLLDALEREKRFARNVAHELRTPLAEMRMLAEVGDLSQSLEEARLSLAGVTASATELQLIVDSLLALGRYESGAEQPQTEPLDLVALLHHELTRVAAAARQRRLRMSSHLTGEYWILSDALLLQRLVANLLGNAVSHAPDGATICVVMSPEGSLLIDNPAPHLEQEDVARLRERFYRVDSGRGGSHAGLGLALSEAIAAILGLQLELQLGYGRKLMVTVTGFRSLPG